tara:strand:- start:190 stop:1086 length:897 start_codon:yes stop_codon:yes gene_type:complete
MQNLGLGNATDPLTSLCAPEVYSIPMVLLIGWRGNPHMKDEPQHLVTGRNTLNILRLFKIKTVIIRSEKSYKAIGKIINYSKKFKKIVAIVVPPKIFSKVALKVKKRNLPKRPEVIEKILRSVKKNTRIICTIGFSSREFLQVKKEKKIKNGKLFLMVGGMGHASATSLGVYLNSKRKDVICVDGDGAFLMHMGNVATVGAYAKKNFKYILFDNNAHESTGVQPTISDKINFKKIASGFGFKRVYELKTKNDITKKLKKILKSNQPTFIRILVSTGSLKKLERPKNLYEIKNQFMSSK